MPSGARLVTLALCLASLALAGCASDQGKPSSSGRCHALANGSSAEGGAFCEGPGSAAFTGPGCGGRWDLVVSLTTSSGQPGGGTGTASVTVTDAGGRVLFGESYTGADANSDWEHDEVPRFLRSLEGEPPARVAITSRLGADTSIIAGLECGS